MSFGKQIKVIDWVRGQQPEAVSDPFEGKTKLFKKPVYNCFVVRLIFFQNWLIPLTDKSRSSNLRICTTSLLPIKFLFDIYIVTSK